MTYDTRQPVNPASEDGVGATLAVMVFVAAYFALALGDTMLLAPSRAAALDAADDQGPLAWSGAAAHLAQLDVQD